MTCKCFDETADMLTTRLGFTEAVHIKPHKAATLVSVTYAHAGVDGTGRYVVMVPFTVRWQMPNGALRTKEIPVRMSFCPFCGRSLQPAPVKKKKAASAVHQKPQSPPLPPAGAGW